MICCAGAFPCLTCCAAARPRLQDLTDKHRRVKDELETAESHASVCHQLMVDSRIHREAAEEAQKAACEELALRTREMDAATEELETLRARLDILEEIAKVTARLDNNIALQGGGCRVHCDVRRGPLGVPPYIILLG